MAGPLDKTVEGVAALALAARGKSGGGEEARCVIPAEAHDEQRATSATASRGRCYHWHWSADNFGHDQTSRYKAKRGVRSAAATELKLGVPFYEMYASFLSTTFVRDSHSNSDGAGGDSGAGGQPVSAFQADT